MCEAGAEALCERLDPVMSQHHRLREAEVELLLQAQVHTMSLGYREHPIEKLCKFLLRLAWRGKQWLLKQILTKKFNSISFVILTDEKLSRTWLLIKSVWWTYMANKHRWPSCLSHVWKSECVHHEEIYLQSGSPAPQETWPAGSQEVAICRKQSGYNHNTS